MSSESAPADFAGPAGPRRLLVDVFRRHRRRVLLGAACWTSYQICEVLVPGHHPLTAAQAQQIALARIALADPPVVILDEATAEAGSAGARALEASARAVLRGRTAVVVAHRLSQAQECDQIAVMSAGRIVERGSHPDLVAAGGPYAQLWQAWRA